MTKINTALLGLMMAISFMVGFGSAYGIKQVNETKVKKMVIKHERHGNIFHRDGNTTEVYSHTIRYGDSMRVEIDTFIYR